jgi:hypothetical protein
MRVLKSLFVLFVILLIALLLPLAALAQEENPEEASVVLGNAGDDGVMVVPFGSAVEDTPEVQIAVFVTIFFTALWNLVYIPAAAPLVQLLTSVSKRLPFLDTISAPALTLTFTIIAWIAYVVITQLGYGDRFDDMITALTTIASVVFGIPATQIVARNIHAVAQKHGVPIFGYSRTPGLSVSIRTAIAEVMEEEVGKLLNGNKDEAQKVPINEAAAPA